MTPDPFLSVGLKRNCFDNKAVNFEDHIKREHNMWHYLFFYVQVHVKDPTEFTGPESYVSSLVNVSFILLYFTQNTFS